MWKAADHQTYDAQITHPVAMAHRAHCCGLAQIAVKIMLCIMTIGAMTMGSAMNAAVHEGLVTWMSLIIAG